MKYQRINERLDELLILGKKAYQENRDSMEYDMEIDCIEHLFGAGGF